MNHDTDNRELQMLFKFYMLGLLAVAAIAIILDFRFWVLFIIVFGLWIRACKKINERKKNREQRLFDSVFVPMGGGGPSIEKEHSYGWASYTVTFDTKEDYDRAKKMGLIENFKGEVQKLYGNTGTKKEPFDAERAVFATWEGRVFNFTTVA